LNLPFGIQGRSRRLKEAYSYEQEIREEQLNRAASIQ